jgi:hypothetical protein
MFLSKLLVVYLPEISLQHYQSRYRQDSYVCRCKEYHKGLKQVYNGSCVSIAVDMFGLCNQ